MQDRETFEYAIIRYVPKVERGEFINVGVIVFCKKKSFLDVKYELNKERLSAFSPDADLDELASYLKSWKMIAHGSSEGGPIAAFDLPYRFRWLTAARSTFIQSSNIHVGLTENPHDVLEDLFTKYVS